MTAELDSARTAHRAVVAGDDDAPRRHPRALGVRLTRVFPATPTRPLTLYNSWAVFAAVAGSVVAGVTLAVWISTHLLPDPTLHRVALFVHLASLVIGLGSVLVADYHVMVWLVRRCTFAEAVQGAGRLHVPIWAGLAGLVLSGTLLEPDVASAMTRVKFALVMILALNGLQAMVVGRRMQTSAGPPGTALLVWGAVAAAVSQGCWWGAVWIGFWTTTSR